MIHSNLQIRFCTKIWNWKVKTAGYCKIKELTMGNEKNWL